MNSPSFDEAFARVQELEATFRANEPFYLSPEFSEAQARKDFIDKFLVALGWDVNHDHQRNPYEQEVKVEKNELGSQRRADYALFLAPNFRDVRFFVEAKKPHGEFGSPDNYFQTIRYGWPNRTPFAILTNFDELHVLDCRFRPDISDTLSRVVERFAHTDYADVEKFGRIYWLFSREAVANQSLEKLAENRPKPKSKAFRRALFKGGYHSIDESFLTELDEYRETLAGAFKAKNPDLGGEELTEVTQRTLDRLVFTRFLEDKFIEPHSIIANLGRDGHAWEDFVTASLRLDRTYNGIVFKRHGILDAPGFQVVERDFARVCDSLSDPTSPYNFDAIPIHILGSIYERFLGKVIVTKGNRAHVEEKPEVRKAHGVYYTPEYICRYIVENTVGKLIERKTPIQIAELRFADLACGSGSFLMGVFDLLLRYHTKYYNENPTKAKKRDCVKRDGVLHLSLQKKREILLNNIYGVDIDRQAVEVAQLSLYLKLLEDETPGSAHAFQTEFHFSLLPSLNENIVCGNSLIGSEILVNPEITPEEAKKINPMDFEQRFPVIMRAGGFDAIVGNPPYVRQESLASIKGYLESHYESFDSSADLYTYFMEKSLRLLKPGGLFSYIVSSSFLRTTYGEALRRYLKKEATVRGLVDFGGLPVFANAKDTYVCIPILTKGAVEPPPRIDVCKIPSLSITNLTPYVAEHSFSVPSERFSEEAWALLSDAEAAVFEKVKRAGGPLGEYIEHKMFYGLKTGLNEAFAITAEQRLEILQHSPSSANLIKPFLGGEDIRRYYFEDYGKFLIVIPSGWTRLEMTRAQDTSKGLSERHAWGWLSQNHSEIAQHLFPFKKALRKREDQGDYWWELRPCDYYSSLGAPKIIFPDICKGPRFCIDRSGIYLVNTAYCIGSDSLYLLALLNSRLFWFAISNISIPFGTRGGQFRYRLIYQYIEKVPIRRIDLAAPADILLRDRIVGLTEEMLKAKGEPLAAQTDANKEFYERKCASLDHQIDSLVYELYGLTRDEIEIVEGITSQAIQGTET